MIWSGSPSIFPFIWLTISILNNQEALDILKSAAVANGNTIPSDEEVNVIVIVYYHHHHLKQFQNTNENHPDNNYL